MNRSKWRFFGYANLVVAGAAAMAAYTGFRDETTYWFAALNWFAGYYLLERDDP